MKKAFQLSIMVIAMFALTFTAIAKVIALSYIVGATAQVVDTSNLGFPITVSIFTQSGVTGSLEKSTSPNAGTNPSGANWITIASGIPSSSSVTQTIEYGITAVRFTRQSGASSVIGEIDYPY